MLIIIMNSLKGLSYGLPCGYFRAKKPYIWNQVRLILEQGWLLLALIDSYRESLHCQWRVILNLSLHILQVGDTNIHLFSPLCIPRPFKNQFKDIGGHSIITTQKNGPKQEHPCIDWYPTWTMEQTQSLESW